MQGNAKNRWKK